MSGKRRLRVVPAKFTVGFLDRLDRRFLPAIAARQVYEELTSALGGEDRLSPQRRMLCERVTWLHLCLQQAEQAFVKSGQFDGDHVYAQRIHALVSLLKTLGLDRVATRAPTLAEVIAKSEGKSA